MAGKTAENGGVTAENALITYFKCAVKNKFGPLAGQQDNEPIMDVEMPSAETDSADLGDSAPEPSQAKQVKPPPLCFPTRLREKYGAFRKMLNAVSAEYHIQFAGDSTLVYFKAKTDYDKFVQQHKSSVPFYTYTPKGQKTNAYVIKGLHEDVEESDVKNELLELGIERSVTLKDLQKSGRYLQHTRVYYEPHTSKKQAIQCHKCQQWGHATANCYLSVIRCVKCGQGHKPSECTLPREQPAKCCNCGEAHPASSSKCPVYLKYIDSREQKKVRSGASAAARAARYVPAPPPKENAWDRSRFPPLPVRQPMPSPSTSTPVQESAERPAARPAPPPTVDEETQHMSEIADTMREIKRMVDLKALAAGLKKLKEKLQGCRNNFEKAMAIDEFNAGDFNGH
ncbi:hypothetical protein QE152_g26298 [Popillia japonica]|uniref:Nucleic-acid-binding protein from transposon X-element n=1 Tax=Popillia japonica TaxID=7064 RepID=A0AAW1JY91_POPJA